MKTVRAFFAIGLEDQTQKKLKKIQNILTEQLPLETVRWTSLGNMHVTLQFLKDIAVLDLPGLINELQYKLKTIPSFYLHFEKLVFFPSKHRPVVIALEVGPTNLLSQIVEEINKEIKKINYPIAHCKFRGHLTLGRLRDRRPQSNSLDLIRLPTIPKIIVNQLCLFESKSGLNHQIYTPLAVFKLTN